MDKSRNTKLQIDPSEGGRQNFIYWNIDGINMTCSNLCKMFTSNLWMFVASKIYIGGI